MKKYFLTMVALLISATLCFSAPRAAQAGDSDKMAWWNEAKFGLFIHWGPYSLYGGVYKGHQQQRSGAEWIMNRCKIPVLEYREMASHFNPTAFDADLFVQTAKSAGMKYLVFTTKHHDGFAMFKSDASRFNIVDWTPFGRDIVDELAQACKKADLPFGFYYSQSQDWCNPGGSAGRKLMKEGWPNPDSLMIDAYTKKHNGHWDGFQDERTFDEYIHAIAIPQLKEILSRYGNDMKILFFDTPTRITSEEAAEILELFKPYPHIIFNDRLKRPDYAGDYKTPEQKLPSAKDIEGIYWETCMTLGSSWGYKSWDTKWKTPQMIVEHLVTIASLGGNFLLNIGPMPTGELRHEETDCLKEVGKWMEKYGEAIYGTVRSGVEVPWGRVIRKDGAKASSLYLCISEWPSNGSLTLPGSWKARKATCLQDGATVRFSSGRNGVTLRLPAAAPAVSPEGTPVIVRLELKGLLPTEKLSSNSSKYFSIVDETSGKK